MKRPAFQFYPAEWRNNAKLRRCTEGARGVWIDALCLFHDSDEYGVLRWPLQEIARALGVSAKWLRELSDRHVLKGSDTAVTAYIFTPRHGGKDGDPVTLIAACDGPCWYSSRMVRDEWVRGRRGGETRFDSENQPPNAIPKGTPKVPPIPPFGDGPSSSSSSSLKPKTLTPLSDSAAPNPDADLLGKPHPKINGYGEKAVEVLDFLNAKTEHSYRPTPLTLKPIIARLKEGYTVSECKAVIVRRWRAWGADEKMAPFLRPATLFGGEKFAQYVGEVPAREDQPG